MTKIQCPHCGSPVMVRGNQWECGWCGDFGTLSSLPGSERAKLCPQVDAAESDVLEPLEQGVHSILTGIQEHFGEGDSENRMAAQLAIYGMSHALLPTKNQTSSNLQLLQMFFKRYSFGTAAEVMAASHSGTAAFQDQFLLTKEQLGSFWKGLLPELPREESYKAWPDWLFEMVDGLSRVESVFSGEDSSVLFDAYQEALEAHGRIDQVRHPDRAALEDAVRRWDFSQNEWICRDLLIAAFPKAVKRWTADELLNMDTMDLLIQTGEQDPDTAVQMMELLLDTAEDHLQEPEAAEQLLGNDLYDLCQDQGVQPKILEQLKKDDSLAQHLFQSAYVGELQEGLLEACDWFDERALKEQLQDLLDQNPYFEGFE